MNNHTDRRNSEWGRKEKLTIVELKPAINPATRVRLYPLDAHGNRDCKNIVHALIQQILKVSAIEASKGTEGKMERERVREEI